ncbi:MAG: Redoxin domain protein, partial [Bryobacterales bacterium]|nr:Redoxin domain protein [Bryobacterales bacterium]
AVHAQVQSLLKHRALDQEPHLPLALGAAIEVHAQALGAQGQRSEAIAYLQAELKTYYNTSIRTRIQKNILLLSLEGKPAPPLDMTNILGPKAAPTKGHTVLLFFWAHWCGDCKGDAPVLAQIHAKFPALTILGPTQHYGYIEGGLDAPAAKETAYIEKIRQQFYPALSSPLSEENFRAWGASTTPTIVLIDKQNIVRLYHPGAMSYDELAADVQGLSR